VTPGRFFLHRVLKTPPSLHTPPWSLLPTASVVGSVARVAIENIHKIPRDDPIRLLARMQFVEPQEAIRRGIHGAHGTVQAAVVHEAGDVRRGGAIEVGAGLHVDVKDLGV